MSTPREAYPSGKASSMLPLMDETDGQPRPRPWQAQPSTDVIAAFTVAVTRLNADGHFIVRALTDQLLAERPIADQEELTPQEISYLIWSKAFTPESLEKTSTLVARGGLVVSAASTLLTSVLQTMSASAAAAFLNMDEESLFAAADRGELYMVDVAQSRRFPSWQFSLSSPGKLLPHLTEIIDIVKDKGWMSVSALMATPQSTMVTDGQHSPVEWFRRGGDVEALARIIEGQKWR